MCAQGWCNTQNGQGYIMHEVKASALPVIAPFECTTLKHAVPAKCDINTLFLVTVTSSQADVLKLTAVSIHYLIY